MIITCLFSWDYKTKEDRDEEARRQIGVGRLCVTGDNDSSGTYSLRVYCTAHPSPSTSAGMYEEYESVERRDTTEGEAYTHIAYHLNEGKILSFTYDAITQILRIKLFRRLKK